MRLSATLAMPTLAICLLVANCCHQAQGQAHTGQGTFGTSKNQGGVWEPTISFIRQNMRLVQSYVALFRSIFVGTIDRPLITSTDSPRGITTMIPAPAVVPINRNKQTNERQ